MSLRFLPTNKWKREAFYLLIYIAVILPLTFGILSTGNYKPYQLSLVYVLYLLLFVFGLYRIVYYYRLQIKPYILLDKDYIFIYQGMLLPHKKIPIQQIERIKHREEIIVLEQKNNKEDQIYTNLISPEDTHKLKQYFVIIRRDD